MRVACSCHGSPASVQRNAFERARSARRARNRAGLGVMAPLVRTAHVSSMACLAAWSRTHLFFIVLFFSILTLPLSLLLRAQFTLQHLARGCHGQLRTELDETRILVVAHVLFRPGHHR